MQQHGFFFSLILTQCSMSVSSSRPCRSLNTHSICLKIRISLIFIHSTDYQRLYEQIGQTFNNVSSQKTFLEYGHICSLKCRNISHLVLYTIFYSNVYVIDALLIALIFLPSMQSPPLCFAHVDLQILDILYMYLLANRPFSNRACTRAVTGVRVRVASKPAGANLLKM